MTEDQIERIVASKTDRLDARYLDSKMTQEIYLAELKKIDDWAEAQHPLKIIPDGDAA